APPPRAGAVATARVDACAAAAAGGTLQENEGESRDGDECARPACRRRGAGLDAAARADADVDGRPLLPARAAGAGPCAGALRGVVRGSRGANLDLHGARAVREPGGLSRLGLGRRAGVGPAALHDPGRRTGARDGELSADRAGGWLALVRLDQLHAGSAADS